MSHSSCQARGSQPSVASSAVTKGSPATSASRERAAGRQRVPGRKHEHARLRATAASSTPAAATGGRDQRDVAAVVEQAGAGWAMSKICSRPRHPGMFVEPEQPVLVSPAAGAEPDRTACRRSRGPHCARPRRPGPGRPASPARQRGTRRRPGSAPAPLSSAPAALPPQVFQLPDLGAQHLLGDVHAARGRGEARLLRDRDEVPEVAQLDVHRGLYRTAGIQIVEDDREHRTASSRRCRAGSPG